VLVIADTSPLNYLILIEAVDLLPRLYGQVILPQAALNELRNPAAPPLVWKWATSLPEWIEARNPVTGSRVPREERLETLGPGEREAITLAEQFRFVSPVLLLLDEEAARREASFRQLPSTAFLGVLKAALRQGWVDLAEAFARLGRTNFRVSPKLLQTILDQECRTGDEE
jgi:predicted nucleic acid-binding protein